MKTIIASILLTLATSAQACLPTQAGGTGTEYRVAEKNGNTVAVWLCGKTWRWVGARSVGLHIDKIKGKPLTDKLGEIDAKHGYDRDRMADLWPDAKALIERAGRKVEGVQA